jgi:hypothetical protein
MLADLNLKQQELAVFMSDISERCYSAGWMMDLEYVLWEALTNGERKYGHDIISPSDIIQLKQLSKQCNCWIYFDDINDQTAIELDQWQEKFTKNFS